MKFTTILVVSQLSAAPPTAKEETAVRGLWRVEQGNDWKRTYDIDAFRNVVVDGGGMEKRKGKMVPFKDGGFLIHLNGGNVVRVRYLEDTDELQMECYTNQEAHDKGLDAMWTTVGMRITHRKS